MTTPNSLISALPPAAPTQAGTVSPLDALAAAFDVQDPPFTYTIPDPPKPTQPAPSLVPPTGQPAPSTPVAAAAAPVVESQQKHPTWLLKQATEMAMHPLLIDRLDTAELTQIVVEGLRNRFEEQGSASRTAAVQNPNPPGQNPNEVAAAAVAAEQARQAALPPEQREFEWGEFQDYDEYGRPIAGKKKKYTDDDINPALGHHIKALVAEVKELKSFIGNMQNQMVANADKKFESEFDKAFSEFPNVFGVGTAKQVAANKEQFERRKLIFGAVKAMMKTLPPQLADKMTIRAGVHTFAKSMFGVDPVAAAANGNGHGDEVPDFTGAGVARPTQRTPSPKPLGRERAADAVKQWWDEQKADGATAGDDTSLDEFIG